MTDRTSSAVGGLSKNRIEVLADGIFAVAMTHLRLPPFLYAANLLLIAAAHLGQIEYLRRHPDVATSQFADAVAVMRRRAAWFMLIPVLSMAMTFYSPRLALYLYLTLPLVQILPNRLDSFATPSVDTRRSKPS